MQETITTENKIITDNLSETINKEGLNEDRLKELYRSFGLEELKEVFRRESIIARILMDNPGSFKMLEIVYSQQKLEGAIDHYLLNSLSAQALRNRLVAIISYLVQRITEMKEDNKKMIKIANLGSGSGRDTIEAVKQIIAQNEAIFNNSVLVDCIDIDPEALACGEILAQKKGVSSNVRFINSDLFYCKYRRELDLGLLIGILCSLEHHECVTILKKIKRYFKPGGILIASNVANKMREEEPFFSEVVLGKIIGWRLVYKSAKELEEVFKKAGYKVIGKFYDEPLKFHGMTIGSPIY